MSKNQSVNFGKRDFNITGGGIPEGNFAFEHHLQMWKGEKSTFEATLGCMITAYDLQDTSAEPRSQFYSMGRNAHKSFTVDPDSNGKKLMVVAGGPTPSLYKNTDWDMYLDSLYACGLPDGVFMDDISVLDGIHVHIHPVPESEERQAFKKQAQSTAEAEIKKSTGPKMVGIVTEIIAKPWEGQGGIPKAGGKGKGKAAAKDNKPNGKATEGDEREIATDALGTVLTSKEFKTGGKKVKIRIKALELIEKKHGDDISTKVSDEVFDNDAIYSACLEEIGFMIKGSDVVVQ